MKLFVLICAIAACRVAPAKADTAQEIVALERQMMDAWQKGSPDAALALLDDGVTYFHVMTEKRLEGVAAVKALYDGYRGAPLFDSYEIENAKVQAGGDVAVLTFRFVTRNGSLTRYWNATEVYERKAGGWRVIHSHFSAVKPDLRP
jgi:ketosteroid isomerase-like protein